MNEILLIGNVSLESTVHTGTDGFDFNGLPESSRAPITDEAGGCVINLAKVVRQIGGTTEIAAGFGCFKMVFGCAGIFRIQVKYIVM
jgi:hypothetical protein